jgi:hypothetical protein
MVSATHTTPVNKYLVDVLMPFGSAGYLSQNTQVMEFTPHPNSSFQVLLGRDILCRGVLNMAFDGTYTFCL